jgi:hypothetical protein
MEKPTEEDIRIRAYDIWVEAGNLTAGTKSFGLKLRKN